MATTFFGWLPKMCQMNKKTKSLMKYVNLYGNGLSIGAALLIIIPEGVGVMTAAYLDKCHLEARGAMDDEKPEQGLDPEFLSKSIAGFDSEAV